MPNVKDCFGRGFLSHWNGPLGPMARLSRPAALPLPPPVLGDRRQWMLDPSWTFVNHGSFGAYSRGRLRDAIAHDDKVEVPIWKDGPRRWVRASCQAYTRPSHAERLIVGIDALG